MRVAFVKHGGMTIGGSELWLQKLAANLPKSIEIDYYYCDDTPYIGGTHAIAPSSQERIAYLEEHGIRVIKFNCGAKNVRSLTHDWVDTNFWEVFDEEKYDLIQTVKAGPREYPFYKMKKPVVEIVALANRPDTSKNIAWSFHSSNWQRAKWVQLGGSIERSSVLSAPVEEPQSTENYREYLGIPANAIVAGFHQRNDNNIASDIPLAAFARLQTEHPEHSKNWHFVIKNGGSRYRDQAEELGLKNVHFLGQTSDSASVSKFLNTLDVFAHGRKDGETFGAVFIEAMLHGKPCLSHYSETGANAQPETMGPAGLFARDISEYAAFLFTLLNDPDTRNALAAKARPHATRYYSMDKCIEETVRVYEMITDKKIAQNTHAYTPAIPYGYSDMGFLYAGDMNKPYNIAYHVLKGGIPEAHDVAIVRSLLPFTKTFFDIGANTGIYCWIAAQYYTKNRVIDASVHAFEPQKECFAALEATRALNNWEPLVSLHSEGLGEEPSVQTLYLSGTGSSVQKDFIGGDPSSETIEIDTLDRVIQKLQEKQSQFPVDFIKIDVEGFEYSVLKGSVRAIEKHKPILFIEIAHKIPQRSYTNPDYSATLEWLFKRGYRIWTVGNNTIKEIQPGFAHDGITMYLCLHENKHADLVTTVRDANETYRREHLFFGIIEKRLIEKAVRKIIPPYVTKDRVLQYLRRVLRF